MAQSIIVERYVAIRIATGLNGSKGHPAVWDRHLQCEVSAHRTDSKAAEVAAALNAKAAR